jgi:hypothetical protein
LGLENGGVTLGPFDIAPERIEAIGASFTPFVNKLLGLETRACGLQGHHLSINSKENTPDGGVDASLLGAPSTDYLPIGDSAWQFKRTNLGPKACADECLHLTAHSGWILPTNWK